MCLIGSTDKTVMMKFTVYLWLLWPPYFHPFVQKYKTVMDKLQTTGFKTTVQKPMGDTVIQ